MKLYQLVFSPTGGTAKVCEAIASGFDLEQRKLSILPLKAENQEYVFTRDDIVVIGAPSYGGRVPVPFASRMKKVRGNGARAILAAVYGNREFEDTLLEMQDLAEAAGFRAVAAVAALAEHSITRHWAVGRPDQEDCEELKAFGRKVLESLDEESEQKALMLPGNRPYRSFGGIAVHPKADEKCDRCGACAKICPTGAIPADDPKETIDELCITCMGCVAICPQHARSLPESLVKGTIERLDALCQGHKPNQFFYGPIESGVKRLPK